LDWNRDKLFGWHRETDFRSVAGFVMAIEMGYEMPAVDVVKRHGLYFLCGESKEDYFQYGGHNRSIAKYILNRLLNVNLWDNDNDPSREKRIFVPIEDSVLEDLGLGYTWYDYLRKKDANIIAKELGQDLVGDRIFLDSK